MKIAAVAGTLLAGLLMMAACNDGATTPAPAATRAIVQSSPAVRITVLPVQAKTGNDRIDAVRELLRGVTNDGYKVTTLKTLTYDAGTLTAAVDFVTDTALTAATTRDLVRMRMSAVYTALLIPGEGQLVSADIGAWADPLDSNGYPTTRLLVRTRLSSAALAGLNWQADKSALGLSLIPAKWAVIAGGFPTGS